MERRKAAYPCSGVPFSTRKEQTTGTDEPQTVRKVREAARLWAHTAFTWNIQKRQIYGDRNWVGGYLRLGLGTEINPKRVAGISLGEMELYLTGLWRRLSLSKVTTTHWIVPLARVNFRLCKSHLISSWDKVRYLILSGRWKMSFQLDQCWNLLTEQNRRKKVSKYCL